MARTLTRILVPNDFSETSDAALAYARALAARFGASLHLLHVFADPYASGAYAPEVYAPLPPEVREHALRDLEERLRERLADGVPRASEGTATIVTGLTATKIVQHAAEQEIDLIVMGTHGRRGVAHLLLGSVAEHVVRTAGCPVLTVRNAPVRRQPERQERTDAALVA